jgi:hypothetical protein
MGIAAKLIGAPDSGETGVQISHEVAEGVFILPHGCRA